MMTGIGKWWRDRCGVVAVEFAFAFPIIILLTIGTMEVALMMLMDASLQIGIAEASRSGSLTQFGSAQDRVARVKTIMQTWAGRWVPGTSEIKVDYFVYPNLAAIGKPTWIDNNNNGKCDSGEGDCSASSVKLVPNMGVAGSLVVYQVRISRSGFTGVLKLAGINNLSYFLEIPVLNE
ncbi:MAG: TadE/TadG family type IV pilus assembly protein [Bacteroidota bacterium]